MTNFDKLKEEIKDMTPEEFVNVSVSLCERIPDTICDKHSECSTCLLEYLKSEVK